MLNIMKTGIFSFKLDGAPLITDPPPTSFTTLSEEEEKEKMTLT